MCGPRVSISCDGHSKTEGALPDLLVEDLRARRPEALDKLLAVYGRQIQGVAYLVLHSAADAEEVLIDTVLTAWDRIGQLRDPDALRPWLLRIALRRALNRRRSSKHVDPLPLEAMGIDSTAGIPDSLALSRALDSFPPRMRVAVILRYYADLPVNEVASVMGTSPNTVKSQLREGLARLRTWLGYEPSGGTRDSGH